MIFIRYLDVFSGIVAIILFIIWGINNKDNWVLAVLPISWLLNVVAFFGARVLSLPISINALNIWSASIHLHGIFLLICIGACYTIGDKKCQKTG